MKTRSTLKNAIVATSLLLAGCVTASIEPEQIETVANPVIDANFPDPAVIKAADGYYYVYATQGEVDGKMQNIQTARSRDLLRWERLGDALPDKPIWAGRTQDFWAPHVSYHDGKYYLYYSAKPDIALDDKKSGLCLAVATATQPEGPFVDIGNPLKCGDGFVNIDPMAYDDPATGKRLLYWGSGFGPIKVQELASDRISFVSGSKPVDLVSVINNDDPENYQRLVEGAWITNKDGYYYLFYSGDNCCGPNAHYAVMVARSRNATGPFETRAEVTGAKNSVILEADERWIAPGHNAVIQDVEGRHWILYHAVDIKRPREKDSDDINTRRVMLIDRLEWADGWPRPSGWSALRR
ncbi:MAG: family 43 glycosylhydrolase [Sphingomonadaceae bacterium]|nr:family 43 glycosylhydrolase [Sphingomonadaceae bacterium]